MCLEQTLVKQHIIHEWEFFVKWMSITNVFVVFASVWEGLLITFD